jgi:hypothetical protein
MFLIPIQIMRTIIKAAKIIGQYIMKNIRLDDYFGM